MDTVSGATEWESFGMGWRMEDGMVGGKKEGVGERRKARKGGEENAPVT